MTSTTPTGVGWTSLITAAARAAESARPSPLVRDPWAERFVTAYTAGSGPETNDHGPLGRRPGHGEDSLWATLEAYFVCRTPFYDDHVQGGLDRGIRQVVILAAGLDARAARLDVPADARIYEVDTPAVLDFKNEVLAAESTALPHRIPVAADLSASWIDHLTAAGFTADRPTVWLVEGLLMYFDADQADALLAAVTRHSAPGSSIAGEYFVRTPTATDLIDDDPDQTRSAHAVADMFRSGPDAAPDQWLHRHGWSPTITRLTTEIRRHGRAIPGKLRQDRPDPMDVWLFSGTTAAHAHQQEHPSRP